MKLLSSSFSSLSSSTSASSTTSFESKSATASCLAGIFRRILCSGTLPTYPSDHITDETNSAKSFRTFEFDMKTRDKSNETHPGLVARLMGLDSMPETNFRTSISRSRSMNSADRLKEDDEEKTGLHRRAKSTASFRDLPEFIELESDEFFTLSFESVSGRKLETGFGELKQKRRAKGKRLESRASMARKKEDLEGKRKVLSDLNGNENTRRNSADHDKRNSTSKARGSTVGLVPKKVLCQKQNFVGSEAVKPWKPKDSDNVVNSNGLRNKRKKRNNNSQVAKPVKPEVNSEDSSPVSVLNCGQFLIDPEVPISEDGSTSTSATTSRRKLSLETEDNSERQSPRRDDNLIAGEERKAEAKQRKYVGSRKKQSDDCHESSLDVLDEICRLSETEFWGPSWVRKWTFDHEEFQGIGEELEAQILGQLIEELVKQFD